MINSIVDMLKFIGFLGSFVITCVGFVFTFGGICSVCHEPSVLNVIVTVVCGCVMGVGFFTMDKLSE